MSFEIIKEKAKQEEVKIEKLRKELGVLENKISDAETTRTKNVLSDITVSQLRKIWNKATESQRYFLIDLIPDIEEHVDKLESYGGLTSNEIIQEIAESRWNECEWLDNDFESYFGDYCKKRSK